jgi:S-adenosylmethionine/arginine decarboxylase-like enzyme
MAKVWGYALALDIGRCKPNLIRCPHNIKEFSDTLVKRIEMVPYGRPQIIHFGTDDKKGYTLLQLIETSNISAHFSEDTNSAWIDVFSCKAYDIEKVCETVREFFEPEHLIKKYYERIVPEPCYMK